MEILEGLSICSSEKLYLQVEYLKKKCSVCMQDTRNISATQCGLLKPHGK